ncbi:hypothetical protein HZH66_002941 [Vespula vulgaris]|uniref:Uncharacterized protein n=1 Tax=Vespula vulgaris TaxID=7454 RepID=A0A836V0C0_VESVU|nr:hypothetical protein HZH66_002941 [Vespula vulgaris]
MDRAMRSEKWIRKWRNGKLPYVPGMRIGRPRVSSLMTLAVVIERAELAVFAKTIPRENTTESRNREEKDEEEQEESKEEKDEEDEEEEEEEEEEEDDG